MDSCGYIIMDSLWVQTDDTLSVCIHEFKIFHDKLRYNNKLLADSIWKKWFKKFKIK